MRKYKFVIVGGLTFVFDATCFWFLLLIMPDDTLARTASFSLSVVASWIGHYTFTFNDALLVNRLRGFGLHVFFALLAGGVNVGVYTTVVGFDTPIVIAFTLGVGTGAVVNYFLLNRLVFIRPSENNTTC